VRVPGFLRAPERFQLPARDYYGLVHVADWMPTLMTLAGLQGKDPEGGLGSPRLGLCLMPYALFSLRPRS
jgi:hypothetical protein